VSQESGGASVAGSSSEEGFPPEATGVQESGVRRRRVGEEFL